MMAMVKVSKVLFTPTFLALFCHFRAHKPAGPSAVALTASWITRLCLGYLLINPVLTKLRCFISHTFRYHYRRFIQPIFILFDLCKCL